MPALRPMSPDDIVRRLRELGFEGPYSGGSHQYLVRKGLRVRVPNPHKGDVSVDLIARILRQAELSRDEWMGTSG